MTHPWTIRKATLSDETIIADFNIAMALETENRHLDKLIIATGVRRLIQQPEMGFYIVGENNGRIGGSMMITLEWTDWRNGLFWWIQSVYVMPSERRKGLFRAMYDYIHSLAYQNKDVRGIRLYVEKNNSGACKTYQAMGMHETDYRLYEIEFSS